MTRENNSDVARYHRDLDAYHRALTDRHRDLNAYRRSLTRFYRCMTVYAAVVVLASAGAGFGIVTEVAEVALQGDGQLAAVVLGWLAANGPLLGGWPW